MKFATLNLLVVLMLTIWAMPVNAQENTQEDTQQDDLVIRVATFSRQAGFIANQPSLSLTIQEGAEQLQPESLEVKSIEQIIIAIDNSDSMKYILPDLVKKIKKVLPENSARPISIVTFNEQVEIITNFTTSKAELKAGLEKVKPSHHSTRLFDAMRAFQQMTAGQTTHVILITDGTDTSRQAINLKQLLADTGLTFSYLNWGYIDPSLQIDEPGYQPVKKSSLIKVKPQRTLSMIAQRSGGDVINVTDWDHLTDYLKQQFQAGKFVYRFCWYTNNPEGQFKLLVKAAGSDNMMARN